ncbi:MAG TPA: sigma-70 family RNA polymerase sigma factor [Gemmatimonadaceae bacterium]
MSDGDGTGGDRGARLAARIRWRATGDMELVAAVRQGDFEALREFYARFEPLLARYASRAGLAFESWEDEAHDVLCDVVLALLAGDARGDVRSVHAYVIRAFRNRMLDAHRAAERRDAREADERMVLESCSEYAIRQSAGALADAHGPSPAIARLATVLDAALTVEERQMLTWVSNAVPMREIAQWLDIGYSAAKVRLSRLRSRLRERALRHVNECAGAEREELVEFLRRGAGGRTWRSKWERITR